MYKILLSGILCLYGITVFCQDPEETGSALSLRDSSEFTDALTFLVRDNSKVSLSWKVLSSQCEFFSIERSCNGKEFETIGVLKQVAGLSKVDWTDEQPAVGKNIYRVRYSFGNGSQWYTRSVVAFISGNTVFRFYPNPVDNLLIVRTEAPVDLSIVDAGGKPRLSQSVPAGLQTLNVASLEKGVYLVRIYNRQTNQLQQEKLIKN